MLKIIATYSLPEEASSDEFWRYQAEVHAADFKKAAGPGLKRYVVNRVTKVLSGEPKLWGLVETWWESEEAMNEAFRNVEVLRTSEGKTIADDFWSRVVGGFVAQVDENEIAL